MVKEHTCTQTKIHIQGGGNSVKSMVMEHTHTMIQVLDWWESGVRTSL